MPLSRIILFVLVLFVSRAALGGVLVLVLGTQITSSFIVGSHLAGLVVSALVFACMSYYYPARAYIDAVTVGASSYVLGVMATSLVAGQVLWKPEFLVADSIEYAIAIWAGVSLGTRLSRRTAAS